MTRVDFYILAEAAGDPLPVICRLCDKAATAGQRVFVHVPDAGTAEALDGLLWSFRQGSFIAHERCSDGAPPQAPMPAVLLGSGSPPPSHQQVMINLAAEVPPFFSRFERVLELVHGEDTERAHGRARYKYYRDRGYALATHELSAAAALR